MMIRLLSSGSLVQRRSLITVVEGTHRRAFFLRGDRIPEPFPRPDNVAQIEADTVYMKLE